AVAPSEKPAVMTSQGSPAATPFGAVGVNAGLPPAAGQAPSAAPSTGDSSIAFSEDDANNAIIVYSTATEFRRVEQALRKLDVAPKQVLIEATIAEVSLNDQLKFGVRWFLQNNQGTHSATFSEDAAGAVSSVFPGFSYALKFANAQATLNALSAVTKVSVISSPSLMVIDNKTARLQVGDQVPIVTQSAVSTGVVGAPIVNSVTYKDTGVILSITPRINDNGRVLLDIDQEVSDVATTTTSGIDSPTIQQRRIKTSVLLSDSQALTLGGLIKSSTNRTSNKVPILGDIPILGNAFKSKNDVRGKTELIIVITPHIIRNPADARAATAEYRNQMRMRFPRVAFRPAVADVANRMLQ
ncbi:MAG: type II secretion system protein GspD, partial [Hyphomicrobiales bacterium]|nr:type II secretion system protein GspD [Hyphomicrobiales bacterium]